jgi:cytidylyltransferase family
MKKSKNFIARYLTILIGAPLVILLFIYANQLVINIFVSIVSIITLREYYECFKRTGKAKPTQWVGYLNCILITILQFVDKEKLYAAMLIVLAMSMLILFIEQIITGGKKTIVDIMVTIFGIAYVPFLLVFFTLLRAKQPMGLIYIAYIFTSAWGSDTFAYLIGKKFGKHKLTPISPKKTVEGAIGGIVGALLFSLIYTIGMNNLMNLSINYLHIAIVTFVLAIIGEIGDLAASGIKRYCGIKDFSDLLPGHGGMLDRIDSLLLITPFAYILFGML